MGLDINLFREEKGGDPEKVKESEKRRHVQHPENADVVDQVIEVDAKWRASNFNMEQLRKEYGKIMKQVGKKKKESKGQDPCTELIEAGKKIKGEIEIATKEANGLKQELDKMLSTCGNIVHDSVPIHHDEKFNEIVRTWGEPRQLKITGKKGACHHHQVLYMIGGYDPKRGQKISGHRGYFLTGFGALLNLALVNYGMQFLYKKGYTPMQTPFFMKRQIMAETAQLSDFDDQLYKLQTGDKTEEKDELYLIATSEQPLSGYHRGEWMERDQLPQRYAGFSTCFRKEAGAHGKDVWGIFRVHQFEKIEQFCITTPEKSWEEHEKMCAVSEEFLQSLGLPYRVVNIVSEELNLAASKKYDVEAWFPGYEDFRELVSCSNCTDYQSRDLNIRLRNQKTQKTDKNAAKEFVHMLNGTLVATERTLCCILEVYQEDDGVRVPEVLQPFIGTDFIPYVRDVPKKKDL